MTEKIQGTSAIITNKKGELLFVKRNKEPFNNHWSFIGGIGQTLDGLKPDDAVDGEVFGDIGTHLKDKKFLFAFPKVDDPRIKEMLVYTGTINEEEINLQTSQVDEYVWKRPDDRNELGELAFQNEKMIELYLEQLEKIKEDS